VQSVARLPDPAIADLSDERQLRHFALVSQAGLENAQTRRPWISTWDS